jgi:hypothetical protein
MRNPFPETPDTYLARAKAVHKLGLPCRCSPGCPSNDPALRGPWPTLGEFLHHASIEGA